MKRNALILAALFLFVCTAVPALAALPRIYPGALGAPNAVSANPLGFAIRSATLFNTDIVNPLVVDLPIILDQPDGQISFCAVQVLNRDGINGVSCTLYNQSVSPITGLFIGTSITATSTATGLTTVTLPTPLGISLGSYAWVSCTLPPAIGPNTVQQSAVVSYSVISN